MTANRCNLIAAGVAGLLLGACAVPSRKSHSDPHAAQTDSCLRAVDLAEWEPLDEQSILTFEPGDDLRSHLVRLETPIEGLMQARDIVVVDGDLDGRICADGLDGIFVEDCGCASSAIVSIEYLSEKRTAELTGKALIVRTGALAVRAVIAS